MKEKRILKFSEEGLRQLQFFMEGMSFPVAVAAYSEQDVGKLEYLVKMVDQRTIKGTGALCVWCIRQRISYQILFRVSIRSILKHPVRSYDYFRLQKILKRYQQQMIGE